MQWSPQRKAVCPSLHRSPHRHPRRSPHRSRHRASSRAHGPMRVAVRLSKLPRRLLPPMHPHRRHLSPCHPVVNPCRLLQVARCRPAARSFRRLLARLALSLVPTRAQVVVRVVTPRVPVVLPEHRAPAAAPVVLVPVPAVDPATGPADSAGPHVAPAVAVVVAIKTICSLRQCSTRRQTFLYPTVLLSSSAASRRRSSVPS